MTIVAPSIDFLVVGFSNEIDLVDLCLSTIEKKVAPEIIGTVFVIWNETIVEKGSLKGIMSRLARSLGSISNKLCFLERADIIANLDIQGLSGWRLQQALKLVVARFIKSEHFIVLDAKNHLLRDIGQIDFLSANGKPLAHTTNYLSDKKFTKYLENSLSYFGIEATEARTRRVLPTTTPYILKRDVVLELISFVEKKEGCSFAKAFFSSPTLTETTEFLLYYAFIMYRFGSIDEIYAISAKNYATFFSVDPNTPERILERIASLRRKEIKFLGIHRNRFSRLTSDEVEAFLSVWIEHGIFPDRLSAAKFIAEVTAKN